MLGTLNRSRCLRSIIGLAMIGGCHTDPYEQYANTVHQDVDQSAATLARTEARLQLTVVHGHVPLDSAAVWSSELARAAKVLHERATHLANVGPPDPAMAEEHDGLLAELREIGDSVAALGETIAACAPHASRPRARVIPTAETQGQPRTRESDSLAALDAQIDSEAQVSADSAVAECRESVGGALADLTRRVSFAQDELRWTRQRVGRQLATHGVLLGDVSLSHSARQ
jgi:hypothetical protein